MGWREYSLPLDRMVNNVELCPIIFFFHENNIYFKLMSNYHNWSLSFQILYINYNFKFEVKTIINNYNFKNN